FDAFAKFLNAVDVALIHFPFNIFARLESGNFFVDLVVRGDIGYEILDHGKGFERRNSDGRVEREGVHSRFAGEARAAVHFGGTRTTLGGFAIPADGEVGRLMSLNGMERVQNDHAGSERNFVVDGLAAVLVATEDAKKGFGHYFFSS